MNSTQLSSNGTSADLLLPLCEIIIQNSGNTTNSTQQLSPNQTQCRLPESPRRPYHTNVKIYYNKPFLSGRLTFYSKYDPFTGVRTASILGSFLFLVVVYGLYKAKCKKKEWTSQDRLFVERYKRRFNGRRGRRATDFAFMHEPFRGSGENSVAMEQTAKWIQSQPLQTNIPKQNFKSTMGNLCLESFKATIYPVCDSNNINHMPNGNIADQRKSEKNSNAEVEIRKLNEKNLHYQNLWKSRSYDDKVNMQTISTMSSLGDLDIPFCDQDINIAGEEVLYEPPRCPIHDSLTDSGLSASRTDSGSAKPGSPLYRPFLKIHNGETIDREKVVNLPELQPISVTPPLSNEDRSSANTEAPTISFSTTHDIPMVDTDQSSKPVSFNIGTPSSCSSLDNDECFSLTTSPLSIRNLCFAVPMTQTSIPYSSPNIALSAQNNILNKPAHEHLSTPLLSIPNDLSSAKECNVTGASSGYARASSRPNTPRPSITSLSEPPRREQTYSSSVTEQSESNVSSTPTPTVSHSDEETDMDNHERDFNGISQVSNQRKSSQRGATAANQENTEMFTARV